MNPIIFSFAGFDLKWYSLAMLLAVIIGIALVQKEARRFNIKNDFVFNMLFWAIIFGLIGARIYFVIFNWEYFNSNLTEIFKTWEGGLAIHGAIIGGLLTIYVYCKKYKARMMRYIDFIAVPLLLSQAIGRWGNFFNSEAHGVATTAAHLKKLLIPDFIIEGMKIDGVYYTPTFLFESLVCLLLFLLFLVIRRSKYTKVGTMTGLYLIGYGVIRFFIEMSRTDALLVGGFKIAQIVSIVMLVVGLVIITINSRKSKFEDLYNDKSNINEVLF